MARPPHRFLLVWAALGLWAPGAARADSMAAAMAEAYRGNPQLQQERWAVRAVDEQVAQALAAKRPSLTASAGYGFSRDAMRFYLARSIPVYQTTYTYIRRQVGISASQALWHGGALDAAVVVAEAQLALEQSRLVATEQSVLAAVGIACADLIQAEGARAVAADYVQALLRARDGIALLRQRGDATVTDLAQADTRLAAARAQLAKAESVITRAGAQFSALVGRAPDGVPEPLALVLPADGEDDVLRLALEANPALVGASHALAAAEAGEDVARGEALPAVDLVAAYDYGRQTEAATERERSSSLRLSLSVPLYQGGGPSAKRRQAAWSSEERRQLLDDTRQEVEASVRQDWQGLETALAVQASRRGQLAAARRSLDGVERQYQRGNRSFLDTLDALREWSSARAALLAADHGVVDARLRVLALMGRLTAGHLALAVEAETPGQALRTVFSSWADVGQ